MCVYDVVSSRRPHHHASYAMLLLLLLLLLLAAPRRRRVSLDSRRRYSCLVGLPSSRFIQLSSMGLSRFSCILVHYVFIRNVILSAHVAIDHKVHIFLDASTRQILIHMHIFSSLS